MDDGGLRRATAVLTLAPALSRGGKRYANHQGARRSKQ
jgi:hypothetical protein